MFNLLNLVLLVSVSQCVLSIPFLKEDMISLAASNVNNIWNEFKLKNSRSFASQFEEIRRRKNFESNLNKINLHNQKYNNGTVTYSLGITPFSDISAEEFMAYVNRGLNRSSVKLSTITASEYKVARGLTLPSSVDWRTQGYVTPVKDQGSCGSCWAFSSTGSLEGQYFKTNGRLLSFSEQNLVDCTYVSSRDSCATGGWMDEAFVSVMSKGGIQLNSTYPYTSGSNPRSGTCKYDSSKSAAKITSYVAVTNGVADENVLTDAIANVGPISVSLYVTANFQLYKSGVFVDSTCPNTVNHAVTLVGYGTLNGQDYYILKNSWGTIWGDQGYMLYARNRNNMCNIAYRTFYPIVAKELNALYPYGSSTGDYALPKNDDNFEGPIDLGVPFTFFGSSYSTIYINTNGVVSFLSPINKQNPAKKFPISTPLISPFWSDINTLIGGRIYYRESSSSSDLNQAKSDIARIYSSVFNVSRVYIITWDQVAGYEGSASLSNTFQVVLATDGRISFLVFNFGKMSWPNSQFSMNSFFGYNAGDNVNFYSYPDSFTNNITSVSTQSNVNIPGKWIFMVSTGNLIPSTVPTTSAPTVYSLATNVPTLNLINQGYKVVYNKTYGTSSYLNDLTAVYNQCNALSIICLAGASVGSNTLLLVSCANCYTLLSSNTVLDQPRLINNAYWYYTASRSVGFSPSNIIAQNTCDYYDVKNSLPLDPLRLCWHLDSGGGWRIGSIVWLNSDSTYLKLLFLR